MIKKEKCETATYVGLAFEGYKGAGLLFKDFPPSLEELQGLTNRCQEQFKELYPNSVKSNNHCEYVSISRVDDEKNSVLFEPFELIPFTFSLGTFFRNSIEVVRSKFFEELLKHIPQGSRVIVRRPVECVFNEVLGGVEISCRVSALCPITRKD